MRVCLRERERERDRELSWLRFVDVLRGSWRDLLFGFIYRSRYCPRGLRCGQLVLRVLLEFRVGVILLLVLWGVCWWSTNGCLTRFFGFFLVFVSFLYWIDWIILGQWHGPTYEFDFFFFELVCFKKFLPKVILFILG